MTPPKTKGQISLDDHRDKREKIKNAAAAKEDQRDRKQLQRQGLPDGDDLSVADHRHGDHGHVEAVEERMSPEVRTSNPMVPKTITRTTMNAARIVVLVRSRSTWIEQDMPSPEYERSPGAQLRAERIGRLLFLRHVLARL